MRGEYYDKQIDGIDDFRLTPACAGNTGKFLDSKLFFQAHPRMRGEYTKITAQLQHSHHITSHSLFSSK